MFCDALLISFLDILYLLIVTHEVTEIKVQDFQLHSEASNLHEISLYKIMNLIEKLGTFYFSS